MLCVYFNKGRRRSAVIELPTPPYLCPDGEWTWVSSFSLAMVVLINTVQRFLKGFLGTESDRELCWPSLQFHYQRHSWSWHWFQPRIRLVSSKLPGEPTVLSPSPDLQNRTVPLDRQATPGQKTTNRTLKSPKCLTWLTHLKILW